MKKLINNSIIIISLILFALPFNAQKIFIDQPVRAGDLILFPSVDNGDEYYYLPDKPSLGRHEDGKPQMLFMKFVENVRSGVDEEDVREAEGGGIFHAVVSFAVSEQQLQGAQRALEDINENGMILGPVIYKSGTVVLISAVADEKGEHVKRIVGLGNAPLVEGQKAAVAFLLDKKGAKMLWNTFETPTPDISFSFEMEVGGYLTPIKGWVKGNFDQIYEADEFKVGGKFTYPPGILTVGAEVGATFERLRREGAIEVYQEGGDENFDDLLKIAFKKLADMIFEPANQNYNSQAAANPGTGMDYDRLQKGVMEMLEKGKKSDKEEEDQATKVDATKSEENGKGEDNKEGKPDSKKDPEKVNGKKKDQPDTENGNNYSGKPGGESVLENDPALSTLFNYPAFSIKDYQQFLKTKNQDNIAKYYDLENGEGSGMFAITAAYQYTRRKQSGKFEINLNKVSADERFFRFDENIGDVRKECKECFLEINLYDPTYIQREILVMMDGYNVSDFGKYINYASINMKKVHENGDITFEEVRIDQKNFIDNNNRFKMMYGWNQDSEREAWLNYEFQSTWSFFGNYLVEEEWKQANANAIALSPPMKRRIVRIEADPDLVKENNIRMIMVKLYYDYGAGEKMEQVILRDKKSLGESIELMLPEGRYDFEYEVMWLLWDQSRIYSERKESNDQLLFVDALPGN